MSQTRPLILTFTFINVVSPKSNIQEQREDQGKSNKTKTFRGNYCFRMLKCVMDVSPIVGKEKNKRAPLSPAYIQSVTRVCQRQSFPYKAHFLNSYTTQWQRKPAQLLIRLGFSLPLNTASCTPRVEQCRRMSRAF